MPAINNYSLPTITIFSMLKSQAVKISTLIIASAFVTGAQAEDAKQASNAGNPHAMVANPHASPHANKINPALAKISGQVTLSPKLGKVSPEMVLFIFARPVSGAKFPVAVLRKQVKDLPLNFTLDDSTAMSPMYRLSGYPEVTLTARISKSGDAIAAPGDLQGQTGVVRVGTTGVNVVISQVLK